MLVISEIDYPVDSHLLLAFSLLMKGAITLVLLPHFDLAFP
jgi:hypothetical protein